MPSTISLFDAFVTYRWAVLLTSGIAVLISLGLSTHLISKHLQHFTHPSVQSKIIAIIYMVPIYSIDSFLSLLIPNWALWINMLRDCYEAYALYLFLSLMLSYLGCEENDKEVVDYLEKHLLEHGHNHHSSSPAPGTDRLSVGKRFLRTCKFGTLQYCLIRPSTAAAAILLDLLGLYEESNLSWSNGNIYILILINFSVAYAFYMLGSFYHTLAEKLQPYKPLGKFLCIKFVLFFAFWQSVAVTLLLYWGFISSSEVAVAVQDWLICAEMVMVSVAHLYAFSYEPFVEGYDLLRSEGDNSLSRNVLPSKTNRKVKRNVKLSSLPVSSAASPASSSTYSPPCISDSLDDPEVGINVKQRAAELEARVFTSQAHLQRPSQLKAIIKGVQEQSVGELLNKHFAADAALRDFNESMPVLVLPTSFNAERGIVIRSDPAQRLADLQREQQLAAIQAAKKTQNPPKK